jgi:hypothetical protein
MVSDHPVLCGGAAKVKLGCSVFGNLNSSDIHVSVLCGKQRVIEQLRSSGPHLMVVAGKRGGIPTTGVVAGIRGGGGGA